MSGTGTQKYFLDPDYRHDAPDEGPYCVRCQKPIRDVDSAILVKVDYETMNVELGGDDLIGADCWKVISHTEPRP